MRPGTLEAALREVRTERAARLANEAELNRADAELGELRALLEAYRSLAEAADELHDVVRYQDARLAYKYEKARATVANLDRSTPATTEQKAAAGKGGAVEE